MSLPNFGSFHSPTARNTTSYLDDPNKKVRKPYTITKSRESWTEPEHDKFLEAIQPFDRDWKKIEAFVGSKTVIQIRSHAQKYFTKAQKSKTNEHLPPPRPKRKAAHPYPQKVSTVGRVVSQEILSFQAPPARRDTSSLFGHVETIPSLPGWIENSVQTISFPHATRDDVGQPLPNINSCGRNVSTPRARSTVLPDFGQVYRFIGSAFDPNVTGHLQKLKNMDPIEIDTVLLLMRNLTVNLASPDFEDHRRLLSSYEIEPEKDNNAYVDTEDAA